MAIRRAERPRGKIGSARPRRLGPPPSTAARPNTFIRLFGPRDLLELAAATGLELVTDHAAFLEAAASAIDDAFGDYANAAAMQANASPAGERRNWCAGLARAAAELRAGLGRAEDSIGMEPAGFDAMDSLRKGWPAEPGTDADRALRERLRWLLMAAVPETHRSTKDAGGEPNLHACWMELLGRLGPALAALEAVAGAAARGWDAETERGGSGRDRARRHLVKSLVPVFARLFGRLPETTPGSAGFRWFHALLERAGQLAADRRALPPPDPEPGEARLFYAALEAVEALARHIAPPAHITETKGTAKLNHWLRETLNALEARPAGAAAGADAASPPARRPRGRRPKKRE